MKVVFLDIDGVLQRYSSNHYHDINRFNVDRMMLLDDLSRKFGINYHKYDAYDVGACALDWERVAVERIRRILEETKAKLVMSTDWRPYAWEPNDKMKDFLKLHDLDKYYIADTKTYSGTNGIYSESERKKIRKFWDDFKKEVNQKLNIEGYCRSRVYEICLYLKEHKDITNFVVIDDMNLSEFKEHFVNTDDFIKASETNRAIEILNKGDFELLMSDKDYYIDKSLFIKHIIDNKSKVCLITRPRKFGKSLNMSMLDSYFNINKDSKELFKDLKIMKKSEKYTSMLNSLPVIHLSFREMNVATYEEFLIEIKDMIKYLYKKLINLHGFDDDLKKEIEKYYYHTADYQLLGSWLVNLCKYLSKYYKKKVLLLIDDYDTILQSAYTNNYYRKAKEFLEYLYEKNIKDNEYIYKSVIMGNTNIFKDISSYTMLNDMEFSEDFGFNLKEVNKALNKFKLKDTLLEVKMHYGGYNIGNKENIFNPFSILNYLKYKKIALYWENIADNKFLNKLLENKNITDYRNITVSLKEKYWNILLDNGYIVIDEYIDEETCKVKVPNLEVERLFWAVVRRED